MSCSHDQFAAVVNVHHLEDVERFVADVRIWCASCHMPFSFPGITMGVSLDKITVSPDATEVRLPLEPGAQAVPRLGSYRVDVPQRRES